MEGEVDTLENHSNAQVFLLLFVVAGSIVGALLAFLALREVRVPLVLLALQELLAVLALVALGLPSILSSECRLYRRLWVANRLPARLVASTTPKGLLGVLRANSGPCVCSRL